MSRLHAPMRTSQPLSAQDALRRFKVRDGFTVDLIASEPTVRQPLSINFDERGRMWVAQYIQYPFPAGLKVTEYDQYLRAKFDATPLPPPGGVAGRDAITVLEDVRGDGSYSKTTTFADGLNIATCALPGAGGVWVMNPPYLLFYPTREDGITRAGDPVVHLSGFGLEDTHAVANSLTWGPDGWIYGAQGSTCTAKVRAELSEQTSTTDFLGQAVWRYQPQTHRFEVFAEGGGNTFGIALDDKGRIFSGTNWGRHLGMYYVQGGRGEKNWGKHGPLMNPYSYGFFGHMPHTGSGERLVHTFEVYGGGLLGDTFTGKAIGVNPLQSRIQLTHFEPLGSAFQTVEEPFLMTTDDGWFRPVGIRVGPDGAVYVADFYEARISHVDPRDTWDRTNGRIYRIRPASWTPHTKDFDLHAASVPELVRSLANPNRWLCQMAVRMLRERKAKEAASALREILARRSGQEALESLWALYGIGALDEPTVLFALSHADPYVRAWTIRLLADESRAITSAEAEKLNALAVTESHPEVRCQLASSALRLPAEQTLPLLARMFRHMGDENDLQIPLLLWWALENKAVAQRERVIAIFAEPEAWKLPLLRDTIARRLARRYAADPTQDNQLALIKLFDSAPSDADRRILADGINDAFEGGKSSTLLPALAKVIAGTGNRDLALRSGDPVTHEAVLRLVAADGDDHQTSQRVHDIAILGQVGRSESVPVLLELACGSRLPEIRKAALAALGRFDDPKIGSRLVAGYGAMPAEQGVREAAVSILCSRPAWAQTLLKGVESGVIPHAALAAGDVDRLRRFDDKDVAALAEHVFGPAPRPSPQEKLAQIDAVRSTLAAGSGDTSSGKALFAARCAACHTLFGQGGKIGPDLTPYRRDHANLEFLLVSIVDPSAAIREEYTPFLIETRDGQSLVGLITDRQTNQITLMDSAQRQTIIPTTQIKRQRAMNVSLMPEELLAGLSPGQLRDLFAYIQSPRPPASN